MVDCHLLRKQKKTMVMKHVTKYQLRIERDTTMFDCFTSVMVREMRVLVNFSDHCNAFGPAINFNNNINIVSFRNGNFIKWLCLGFGLI